MPFKSSFQTYFKTLYIITHNSLYNYTLSLYRSAIETMRMRVIMMMSLLNSLLISDYAFAGAVEIFNLRLRYDYDEQLIVCRVV